MPHFNVLAGVISCRFAISDISLKTRFLGLHFRCRKYWCVFNHFYIIRPESYRIGKITLRLELLRRSRSFKVTEFGTKWRRNIAENFNHLSRVHERYRQTTYRQTDGRTTTDSEEFTFAKNMFTYASYRNSVCIH